MRQPLTQMSCRHDEDFLLTMRIFYVRSSSSTRCKSLAPPSSSPSHSYFSSSMFVHDAARSDARFPCHILQNGFLEINSVNLKEMSSHLIRVSKSHLPGVLFGGEHRSRSRSFLAVRSRSRETSASSVPTRNERTFLSKMPVRTRSYNGVLPSIVVCDEVVPNPLLYTSRSASRSVCFSTSRLTPTACHLFRPSSLFSDVQSVYSTDQELVFQFPPLRSNPA